jgi:hypothetical protein
MEVLAHQDSVIESMAVTTRTEGRFRVAPDRPFQRQSHTITERRVGSRFRVEDEYVDPDKQKPSQIDQVAFNGVKRTAFDPRANTGSQSSYGGAPYGYQNAAYVWNTPFIEKLKQHADQARIEWVLPGGRKLLQVSWEEGGGLVHTQVRLDPAERWQPREIEMRFTYRPGEFPDGRTQGLHARRINNYHREEHFVLPSEIELWEDESYPDGRTVRTSETRVRATDFQINQPIPDDVFEIAFPDGAKVYDVDRKVTFVVGQPGSEQRVVSRPAETVAAQAGPAWTWWGDWRVWLAVTAACVAGIAWFRLR